MLLHYSTIVDDDDDKFCGFEPITTPDEKAAAVEKADAAYHAEYGEVLHLFCDETEADLRLFLWQMRRMEELQNTIRVFFEHCEADRLWDAIQVGVWLLHQHTKFGVGFDSTLLQTLYYVTGEHRDGTSLQGSLFRPTEEPFKAFVVYAFVSYVTSVGMV